MNEISLARDCIELTALAPAQVAFSIKDIRQGLLLSVMMNSSSGSRLDDKESAPKAGFDPEARRKRGQTLRPRRLSRSAVELCGRDDSNRWIFAHDSSAFKGWSAHPSVNRNSVDRVNQSNHDCLRDQSAPDMCSRVASNRNHVRLSASSIQFSSKLVVATSSCSSHRV